LYSTLLRATHLYGAMACVNMGLRSFTCLSHVYLQVERAIPAFTSQVQNFTALWPVLISHTAEGRRLSWPGWIIPRWYTRVTKR